MDWFAGIQKGLVAAQSVAVEAAEQAKIMAAQASEQAKVYAEQAAEHAKVLRAQAEVQIQQLKQNVSMPSSSKGECDLAYYGITEAVLNRVGGLSYATFSESSVKSPVLSLATASGDFRLSEWQEKHVTLVLARVEQLQHLRFALCPKRMDEPLFWSIYLHELNDILPPQAFGLPAMSPPVPPSDQVSQAAADPVDVPELDGNALIPGVHPESSPVHDEDGLEGDIDDLVDDLDENDPELDAYLEAALALEDETESGGGPEGSEAIGTDEDDDLDDYINNLK